ncbi:uncharacterized protein ARMOST_19056 [Armillaria ostoyae]|uniref:Uncharacterized protein n=1 Tax=Armillaria ostoyae TaxID=47428 RepID=A0A284S3H0_ARMOS|nr:uncharacterized protein ARMOST_19056 [Armillaria ostoyae]
MAAGDIVMKQNRDISHCYPLRVPAQSWVGMRDRNHNDVQLYGCDADATEMRHESQTSHKLKSFMAYCSCQEWIPPHMTLLIFFR